MSSSGIKNMFDGAEKALFASASQLRKQQTFAEELLWQYLKTKPLGLKFRRQHVYGIYILDFYCHKLKLVIEVDGSIHDEKEVKQNDEIRQKHLEEDNLTVLRFTNDDIRINLEKLYVNYSNISN
jgi:very-short-patch-repair endonuclease